MKMFINKILKKLRKRQEKRQGSHRSDDQLAWCCCWWAASVQHHTVTQLISFGYKFLLLFDSPVEWVCNVNRRGLSKQPWGAPQRLLILNVCSLFVRRFSIQLLKAQISNRPDRRDGIEYLAEIPTKAFCASLTLRSGVRVRGDGESPCAEVNAKQQTGEDRSTYLTEQNLRCASAVN